MITLKNIPLWMPFGSRNKTGLSVLRRKQRTKKTFVKSGKLVAGCLNVQITKVWS